MRNSNNVSELSFLLFASYFSRSLPIVTRNTFPESIPPLLFIIVIFRYNLLKLPFDIVNYTHMRFIIGNCAVKTTCGSTTD